MSQPELAWTQEGAGETGGSEAEAWGREERFRGPVPGPSHVLHSSLGLGPPPATEATWGAHGKSLARSALWPWSLWEVGEGDTPGGSTERVQPKVGGTSEVDH